MLEAGRFCNIYGLCFHPLEDLFPDFRSLASAQWKQPFQTLEAKRRKKALKSLFDELRFQEILVFVLVAIEYVDVNVTADSGYATIGGKLPDGEADIGLVFAIAGYPNLVVALDVVGIGEVTVHERLADIENRRAAGALFDNAEPCANLVKHDLGASHGVYLTGVGFHVEHGRQVAFVEASVADEVVGLICCAAFRGEKMVGAAEDAVIANLCVVVIVVAVLDGGSLGGLDVAETDGVVNRSPYALVANGAQMCDAQSRPVDAVVLLADVVLIAGNVDSVDAVGGIDQSLTLILIVFPFANEDFSKCVNGKSETVAHVVLPDAVVVGAVGCQEHTVAGALPVNGFSFVDKVG